MDAQHLSAPQICLRIKAGLEGDLLDFSDEAYGRFLAAKAYAEGKMGQRLGTHVTLPAFGVVFAGFLLLITFCRYDERFFVDRFFDLEEHPEGPNPPGGRLPTMVVLATFGNAIGLNLQLLEEEIDMQEMHVFYAVAPMATNSQILDIDLFRDVFGESQRLPRLLVFANAIGETLVAMLDTRGLLSMTRTDSLVATGVIDNTVNTTVNTATVGAQPDVGVDTSVRVAVNLEAWDKLPPVTAYAYTGTPTPTATDALVQIGCAFEAVTWTGSAGSSGANSISTLAGFTSDSGFTLDDAAARVTDAAQAPLRTSLNNSPGIASIIRPLDEGITFAAGGLLSTQTGAVAGASGVYAIGDGMTITVANGGTGSVQAPRLIAGGDFDGNYTGGGTVGISDGTLAASLVLKTAGALSPAGDSISGASLDGASIVVTSTVLAIDSMTLGGATVLENKDTVTLGSGSLLIDGSVVSTALPQNDAGGVFCSSYYGYVSAGISNAGQFERRAGTSTNTGTVCNGALIFSNLTDDRASILSDLCVTERRIDLDPNVWGKISDCRNLAPAEATRIEVNVASMAVTEPSSDVVTNFLPALRTLVSSSKIQIATGDTRPENDASWHDNLASALPNFGGILMHSHLASQGCCGNRSFAVRRTVEKRPPK